MKKVRWLSPRSLAEKVTPSEGHPLPEPLSVLLRKHPFFEKKKNASTFYFTDQNFRFSLMLHLKSSESPQIAARLPVSGGRGPEAKRVRAQAVAGIPEQSLCQFLPEMPLSSPSWNFSQWHLWQKCTHLFWGYTQLHGSKGWTLHRCQPNFLFSQKLGFWLSLIAGRWAELWWVSWLFHKVSWAECEHCQW